MRSFRLHTVDTVPSTNELVKQAIEDGEPEGFAVLAFHQSAGYGRQGRVWKSPHGGMYLSLLLRPSVPARDLASVSLMSALAVRQALSSLVDEEAGRSIRIKWPNDIVAGDADARPFPKLCGISHEFHANALCVGIGVNVIRPDSAPESGFSDPRAAKAAAFVRASFAKDAERECGADRAKNHAVYLEDMAGFRCSSVRDAVTDCAHAVLDRYGSLYEAWKSVGIAPFMEAYNAASALTGSQVRIVHADGSFACEGIVQGTNADGRLLVLSRGETVLVASGEAHIL